MSVTNAQIAAAEFAWDAAGALHFETDFGRFIGHRSLPVRAHSIQLQDCRCTREQIPEMLALLERMNADWGNTHRWVSTADEATINVLEFALPAHGYVSELSEALVHSASTEISIREDVVVSFFLPGENDDFALVHQRSGEDAEGIEYMRKQLRALNGLEAIACIDSQPCAALGFYCYEGVIRFTRMVTLPEKRRQGIGAALIQKSMSHPMMTQAAAIVLCTESREVRRFSERLGFRKQMRLANFFRRSAQA